MAGPVYNVVWFFLCTLYPAYGSFKAVKNKNVKEYVSQNIDDNIRDLDNNVTGEMDDVLDSVLSVLCCRVSLGSLLVLLASFLQ